MNARKPRRACPVCRDAGTVEILHTQAFVLPANHILPDTYDVVACGACGFVYADTPASQDTYDEYYAQMSKYEANYAGEDTTMFVDRAAWISTFFGNREAAIVDLGCGNGQLLVELRDLGFRNLSAQDPSRECICAIQAKGIDGAVGSLFAAPSTRKYDGVVLSGVLEHVRDVPEAMDAVGSMLKAGGYLFVFVPDASRYAEYDTVPYDYVNIEHINHFDEVSLINLGLLHRFGVIGFLKTEVTLAQTQQPVIYCAYRNDLACESDWHSNSRDAIRRYLAKTGGHRRVDTIIGELCASNEQVVVWGAGNYASRLLASSDLDKCNIVCFVDSDRHKQGSSIAGRPVLAPSGLGSAGRGATILVAAAVFHEEIVAEARAMGLENKVVVLGGR